MSLADKEFLAVLPYFGRRGFGHQLERADLSFDQFERWGDRVAQRIADRTIPWKIEAMRKRLDRRGQLWGGTNSGDENLGFGRYIVTLGPAEVLAFLYSPKQALEALMLADYRKYHNYLGDGAYILRTAEYLNPERQLRDIVELLRRRTRSVKRSAK